MKKIIHSALLSLLMLISYSSVSYGQTVEARITIANENQVGTDYFFDLYLHEDAGSSGPIYMGNSQFRIAFDLSKFTAPDLHKTINPAPLFGAQDGYSTLVPTNNDGGFNVASTRNGYYNRTGVSIKPEHANVLNIEINGPAPGDVTALNNTVARIDDTFLGHRIGRFKISGYKDGSGNPSLAVVYGTAGTFSSAVLSYDPATLNEAPVTINNDILPVEWLGFTAREMEHREVSLEWITGAEINNDRFVIEKMLKHGTAFAAIGEVASQGNSNNVRTYQYFDNTPMTDVVYYRIKQIDLDGTSTYSDTEEVKFDFYGAEAYTVYPSPAREEITLEALDNINQAHEFWVLDLQGKEITKGEIEADQAIEKINISELAEGSYFVKIKSPRADIFHLRFTKE